MKLVADFIPAMPAAEPGRLPFAVGFLIAMAISAIFWIGIALLLFA